MPSLQANTQASQTLRGADFIAHSEVDMFDLFIKCLFVLNRFSCSNKEFEN